LPQPDSCWIQSSRHNPLLCFPYAGSLSEFWCLLHEAGLHWI